MSLFRASGCPANSDMSVHRITAVAGTPRYQVPAANSEFQTGPPGFAVKYPKGLAVPIAAFMSAWQSNFYDTTVVSALG